MLDSKTMVGLGILLLCVIGLSLVGKLSAEAVEALKWIGSSFMGVRAAANIAENLGGAPAAPPAGDKPSV